MVWRAKVEAWGCRPTQPRRPALTSAGIFCRSARRADSQSYKKDKPVQSQLRIDRRTARRPGFRFDRMGSAMDLSLLANRSKLNSDLSLTGMSKSWIGAWTCRWAQPSASNRVSDGQGSYLEREPKIDPATLSLGSSCSPRQITGLHIRVSRKRPLWPACIDREATWRARWD